MRSEGETNTQTGGVESLACTAHEPNSHIGSTAANTRKIHAVEKEMVLRYLRHYLKIQFTIQYKICTAYSVVVGVLCCKNIFSEKHEAICGFNDNNKIKQPKKKKTRKILDCFVVLHKIEAALRQISSSSHFNKRIALAL